MQMAFLNSAVFVYCGWRKKEAQQGLNESNCDNKGSMIDRRFALFYEVATKLTFTNFHRGLDIK